MRRAAGRANRNDVVVFAFYAHDSSANQTVWCHPSKTLLDFAQAGSRPDRRLGHRTQVGQGISRARIPARQSDAIPRRGPQRRQAHPVLGFQTAVQSEQAGVEADGGQSKMEMHHLVP